MKRPRFGFRLPLIAVAACLGLSGSSVAHIGFAISPVIVSFTASPDTLQAGGSANVSWDTRGADFVTLAWGPELAPDECLHHTATLPAKGSLQVRPRGNTVYELSCKNNVTEQMCAPMTVVVSVN
jgi:hypothetical protein